MPFAETVGVCNQEMRCYIAASTETNVAKQGCMGRDVEQQESSHIEGLKVEDCAVPGICSLLSIGVSSECDVATFDGVLARS